MSTIRSTTPTGKAGGTTTTAAPAKQATPVTQTGMAPAERIAKRAYEKWLKRGCAHGHDVQDWIEAEKEVMAEMRGSGSTSTATRR